MDSGVRRLLKRQVSALMAWPMAVTAAALAVLLMALAMGMTLSIAAACTYDGSSIARVGVQECGAAKASPAQVSDARQASVSPPVGDKATSTAVVNATNTAGGLGDDVVLVRGGTNTPDRFASGSGVTSNASGNLQGVSVNSGSSVEAAAQGIPNKQIGVSTAGQVRDAGGTVVRAPTPGNPGHCLIGGLSAEAMSGLFTPTIKNPCL